MVNFGHGAICESDKLMFIGADKPCRGDHRSSVTTAVDFMVRAVEDVRPYKRKCCVFP